jgi:Family of unknown function (DUF6152)
MRRQLVLLTGAAFIAMSGVALAHHSSAMFDQSNPIELQGTVQEFKFISPHTFIVLEVKDQGGGATVWNLQGDTPGALVRNGWTNTALKPGDQIKLTVDPLRSGAPGGAWNAKAVKFQDGQPIVVSH